MSVSPNTFQKIYIEAESTFAGSNADFSSGVKLRPTTKVSLENVMVNLSENPTVRDDWDDAGSPPSATTSDAKLEVSSILAGATRSGGVVAEDALSKYLEYTIGSVDRGNANGTVGDGTNSSTTTTIYHDGTLTLTAGDLVMIDNQVRRVDSVASSSEFAVDIPLSSAPADGTTIYTGEVFTRTTSTTYIGAGLSMEDTEIEYLFKGGVATDITFEAFKSRERAIIKHVLEFADFERGVSLTPATSEVPTDAVFAGSGDGLQLKDATGALWSPCVSEATASLGIGYEWIEDIGGTNGKCGASAIPKDPTLEATLYQDGTLSKLENLVEKTTAVCVQLGSEAGSIVGVYFPEASIKTYPVLTDIGALQGVKVAFQVSTGYLFRF